MITAKQARKRSLDNYTNFVLLCLEENILKAVKHGSQHTEFIIDNIDPNILKCISKKLYKEGYTVNSRKLMIGDSIVNEWEIIW